MPADRFPTAARHVVAADVTALGSRERVVEHQPVPAEAVGTPCIDGSALSAADVRRMAESVAGQRERLRRAIYAVAGHAGDAGECRSMFEMMGIDLDLVRTARERHR